MNHHEGRLHRPEVKQGNEGGRGATSLPLFKEPALSLLRTPNCKHPAGRLKKASFQAYKRRSDAHGQPKNAFGR